MKDLTSIREISSVVDPVLAVCTDDCRGESARMRLACQRDRWAGQYAIQSATPRSQQDWVSVRAGVLVMEGPLSATKSLAHGCTANASKPRAISVGIAV